MGEQQDTSLESAVQSYAAWWHEAGLHTATDHAAHGWRGEQAVPFWRLTRPAAPVPAAMERPAEVTPSPAAPAPIAASSALAAAMPQDLPAFLDWLARDTAQPEAGWDSALILPPALHEARLLVIVEMPAAGAADAASLLEAGQRRFISAMLASLGLTPDDMPLVSMATRRPPGGVLDEATLSALAARMTHYLGLARPQTAIILGDRMSRALLGTQWNPRTPGLPLLNHRAGTMPVIALAGADLLMSRPMAKAKSWQALRLLHGAMNL